MKVALCLHGYFDSRMDHTSKGSDGYNHIKKNILDKADVDVYTHCWQPELSGTINDLYNPIKSIYVPQKDFTPVVNALNLGHMPPDSPYGRSPFSILSNLYSLQECIKQIDSEDYTFIIKARYDLGRINRNSSGPGRLNSYPIQCINFDPTLSPKKFYSANWQYFETGPADAWFYSGSDNMKKFKTLYDDVLEFMNESSVNVSILYKKWLNKKP